jgi:hypothetical protein
MVTVVEMRPAVPPLPTMLSARAEQAGEEQGAGDGEAGRAVGHKDLLIVAHGGEMSGFRQYRRAYAFAVTELGCLTRPGARRMLPESE